MKMELKLLLIPTTNKANANNSGQSRLLFELEYKAIESNCQNDRSYTIGIINYYHKFQKKDMRIVWNQLNARLLNGIQSNNLMEYIKPITKKGQGRLHGIIIHNNLLPKKLSKNERIKLQVLRS